MSYAVQILQNQLAQLTTQKLTIEGRVEHIKNRQKEDDKNQFLKLGELADIVSLKEEKLKEYELLNS